MKKLIYAKAFRRALKRHILQRPDLRPRIENVLRLLSENPFDPSLHSHKLKGKLAPLWACTVDYDNRILFMLFPNPETGEEAILLVSVGTHKEVY